MIMRCRGSALRSWLAKYVGAVERALWGQSEEARVDGAVLSDLRSSKSAACSSCPHGCATSLHFNPAPNLTDDRRCDFQRDPLSAAHPHPLLEVARATGWLTLALSPRLRALKLAIRPRTKGGRAEAIPIAAELVPYLWLAMKASLSGSCSPMPRARC
jgi:hypothetical protein